MEKFIYIPGSGGRLFLITFLFDDRKVVSNDSGFVDALKRFDKTRGIKSIKWLSGDKWVRATKREIRQWFSYDTETDLFLDNHYYFTTTKRKNRRNE